MLCTLLPRSGPPQRVQACKTHTYVTHKASSKTQHSDLTKLPHDRLSGRQPTTGMHPVSRLCIPVVGCVPDNLLCGLPQPTAPSGSYRFFRNMLPNKPFTMLSSMSLMRALACIWCILLLQGASCHAGAGTYDISNAMYNRCSSSF